MSNCEPQMELHLEKVEAGNRQSLLDVLRYISDSDCDFNGENGLGYLWDGIDPNVYDSNLDYLLDKVSVITDDEECAKSFIRQWMEHYSGYYKGYEVKVFKNNKNQVTAIACSFMY